MPAAVSDFSNEELVAYLRALHAKSACVEGCAKCWRCRGLNSGVKRDEGGGGVRGGLRGGER